MPLAPDVDDLTLAIRASRGVAGIAAVDLLASPGMIDPEAGELLEEEVVEPWVSDCLFEEKLHDDGIYIVQREVRRTNRRSAQTLEAPPRSVHSSSRWRYPVVHRVRCPSLGGDRMDGDGSNSTGSGADADPGGDERAGCWCQLVALTHPASQGARIV